MVMVPAEYGMRSLRALFLYAACSRPQRAVDLWGCLSCSRPLGSLCRAVDLWGRFVEARVTNASENGMIKSTILKDIGRLSFLEPQARVTATLLEPEARVKQQRRNEQRTAAISETCHDTGRKTDPPAGNTYDPEYDDHDDLQSRGRLFCGQAGNQRECRDRRRAGPSVNLPGFWLYDGPRRRKSDQHPLGRGRQGHSGPALFHGVFPRARDQCDRGRDRLDLPGAADAPDGELGHDPAILQELRVLYFDLGACTGRKLRPQQRNAVRGARSPCDVRTGDGRRPQHDRRPDLHVRLRARHRRRRAVHSDLAVHQLRDPLVYGVQ